MPSNFELILDVNCDVYQQLNPYADDEFKDFAHHEVVPGAVYLIGRHQAELNIDKIKQIASSGLAHIVYSDPVEGSETLAAAMMRLGLMPLVRDKKILLIGGGDMEKRFPYYRYDSFLVKILDYLTNKKAMKRSHEIFEKKDKPYKFLFLNGRTRPQRKYLLERFRLSGLLDQSLWTNLQSSTGENRHINLNMPYGVNLMYPDFPIKLLPKEYEVSAYQENLNKPIPLGGEFIKSQIFGNDWGEVHLKPEVYIDTYFSLVTETVFSYPYSFRTEKIAKPLAIGHPWIAVANAGYYRDIKNLGFKTFGHLIDESFDTIDDDQSRIERITDVVEDLCKQDLPAFLAAAEEVCKYNQEHLKEFRSNLIRDFPQDFIQFVTQHINERSRI